MNAFNKVKQKSDRKDYYNFIICICIKLIKYNASFVHRKTT